MFLAETNEFNNNRTKNMLLFRVSKNKFKTKLFFEDILLHFPEPVQTSIALRFHELENEKKLKIVESTLNMFFSFLKHTNDKMKIQRECTDFSEHLDSEDRDIPPLISTNGASTILQP
eukprot:UN28878